MKSVRRFGCCLGGLLLLAGGVVLLLAFTPRPRSLLQVATKVGPVNPTLEHIVLSDQEVLLLFDTERPRGRKQLGEKKQAIYLLNVPKGTTTFLPKLTAWANKRLYPINAGYGDGYIVSPDGRWILFWQDNNFDFEVNILRADGQKQWDIESTYRPEYAPCWTSDSRHWIAFPANRKGDAATPVRIYSVEEPDRTKPRLSGLEMPIDWYPDRIPFTNSPDGRVIGVAHHPESFTIYEMRLQGSTAPIRKHTILLPPGHVLLDLVISPKGDQVAWSCAYEVTPSAFTRWWTRWIPGAPQSSQYFVGLWVSHLDGKGKREIGREENPPSLPGNRRLWTSLDNSSFYEDLAWMPDGKRLRFIHTGNLYTVPVD